MEVGDLLFGDGPLVGEVEVVEGLGLREAGGFDPVLAAVGLPRGDLFGEHFGQELGVVPALDPGGLGERGSDLAGSGHLQSSGQIRNVGGSVHWVTSARAS